MRSGLMTAASAAIKSKAAVVILAAVVATGSATGVAAAANNGAFGQQVKTQVATCKAHLAQGVHGIGECVSDFAQRHGAQQRQQHSQNSSGGAGKQDSPHGPPSGTPGASNGQRHSKP